MKFAIGFFICSFGFIYSYAQNKRVEAKDASGKVVGYFHEESDPKNLMLTLKGKKTSPAGVCIVDPISSVAAPNGKFTAKAEVRNCGATVDYATRVFLLDGSKEVDVLVVTGTPEIKLRWKELAVLEIEHSVISAEQVYKKTDSVNGLKIINRGTKKIVGPPQSEAVAKANIVSATEGVRLFSLETMQRIAGWSQEASGLHKDSWGHWYGSYPYGDDPLEAEQIAKAYKLAELKPVVVTEQCRQECLQMIQKGELKKGLNEKDCQKLVCGNDPSSN
ncbi:hypothetical protein AZI86_11565 [Bdellovibrio bacteriovorus]|uniref:Uncharacterized protein n=1 Tax=Bdellovibrio bacteriovorus TaxID=959 RepID=A0A150WM99_BDEBC|nr:hypothetical protein [Bdellovibrio bacteriovorus]KYG64833.1 hypothetical protein AZI86_11565 [Bdellovibrio bacteriovorus]